MDDSVNARLNRVQERIQAVCRRAGRNPSEVRLVAVTKTVAVDRIREGIEAGLGILGENYIQEASDKIAALGAGAAQWHFIGRLQTNKARHAAVLFDWVHSVDNLKLAQELDRRAGVLGRRLAILVQVNVSGETSKGGTTLDDTRALVDRIGRLDHLDLKGLMTMPPFFDDPDRARPFFASLRELRDAIGPPLADLSMGMSGDFEAAIEEGATLVRVGTALFGPRS
jgi:pyridoxal phosphate enzyme (YggS family)